MQIRKALPEEYEEIYRMGFDVWDGGQTLASYLDECRRSPKYRRGRWYVLEGNGGIRSSLIMYPLAADTCGIGSIATPPSFRSRGYASKLIAGALELFAREGFKKAFSFRISIRNSTKDSASPRFLSGTNATEARFA